MDPKEIKKILLVDDDADLLEQNKLLLESKGFQVITAENSKDGMKLFYKELPDAAILDLMMEQMDSGFILSYKIKKTEHGKKIPVFILTSATYETGYKFSVTTDEEKEWLKCDGILNKPVAVDELIAKIEKFQS
ncbi:response regulator [Stygiobacter electus]|uniref:Response regulator n=1 Tax=Stygiobacter electus TaxID=3032292 RepID=A0AAE3P225_9BACT|nr:response regulator [Stygiobacter electus]MDF1611395.1 response regulator [Stygiobacter electus]